MRTPKQTIKFARWAKGLFKPSRYKVVYGGRGSGKSTHVAMYLLAKGAASKRRILCAREYQNSLSESVHRLLVDSAERMGLGGFYTATKNTIRGANGTEFIFSGLKNNPNSIKSLEGLTDCWVEEAQTISRDSLTILIPTLRLDGSELVFTLNPYKDDDPIFADFIATERADTWVKRVNWDKNPWCSDELNAERLYMQEHNPALYRHVWEGECIANTEAQVFTGCWERKEFEPAPEWGAPLHGLDFGYSQDPLAFVRMYLYDRTLYISHEFYRVRVENNQIVPNIMAIAPDAGAVELMCDSARPELISQLKQTGLPLARAAKKWAGNTVAGVQFLRSLRRIYIHPRCTNTLREFGLFSWRVDARTGKIGTDLVRKEDHAIDAILYGLNNAILNNVNGWAWGGL